MKVKILIGATDRDYAESQNSKKAEESFADEEILNKKKVFREL